MAEAEVLLLKYFLLKVSKFFLAREFVVNISDINLLE